jgi:hypothetical protein
MSVLNGTVKYNKEAGSFTVDIVEIPHSVHGKGWLAEALHKTQTSVEDLSRHLSRDPEGPAHLKEYGLSLPLTFGGLREIPFEED